MKVWIAFALCLVARVAVAQPIEIPAVLPLTGSAAFLGQSERNALTIAEMVINGAGGVAGTQVHFAVHDDQSSPQVAVQLAAQIKAQHPPIVLGSAIVAMCNAMAPLMADGPPLPCSSIPAMSVWRRRCSRSKPPSHRR